MWTWMTIVAACGGDPVLEAAKAEAEAEAQGGARGKAPAGVTPTVTSSGPRGPQGPKGPSGPAVGIPAQPAPGIPSAPAPGVAGGSAPGVPDEPTPGDPMEPPPGGQIGGGGQGGLPTPEGETVTLRGVIRVEGYSGGPLYIDVFDGDHRDLAAQKKQRISLVSRAKVDGPGPFEVQLPADDKLWLSAYNDIDGDGRPTRSEPFSEYPGNPVFSDALPAELVLELSTTHAPRDEP
ncbi:MAG: hypothetical protein VX899_14650 [Myxococcota bacterium]|nr:hypothetical protein [Myxococcota bacterium]